jgi:hypothetical protein
MDLADLIKVIVATGTYFVVLALGIAVAWWMARRARRKEQAEHE